MRSLKPLFAAGRTHIRTYSFFFCMILAAAPAVWGQQSTPTLAAPKDSTAGADNKKFARMTDDVLKDMSKLLALPQLEPVKKSLRSRDDIRAFVLRQLKEDKEPEKRHADELMLKKLGLFPKDFQLDSFLVDLLTEQIAGLYDPKEKEFFIADWIPLEDQREVMAHELTHALQDQHFHLDKWHDAAKPNDDAGTARDAVLEGSAVASMMDYGLRREKGVKLLDFDFHGLTLSSLLGSFDDSKSPLLKKAPAFLRDDLLFPYAAGADFAIKVLKALGGWEGFHTVFENPPVSTQQIIHPEIYLRGIGPALLALPDLTNDLGKGWKKLDENIFGEFGLNELLKQYIGGNRAEDLSRIWAGDRYAIYQQHDSNEVMLVMWFQVANPGAAERLFAGWSEALNKQYVKKENLTRQKSLLSFDSEDGGVFLRCQGMDCVSMQGGNQKVFDALVRAIGWPLHPESKGSSARNDLGADIVPRLSISKVDPLFEIRP